GRGSLQTIRPVFRSSPAIAPPPLLSAETRTSDSWRTGDEANPWWVTKSQTFCCQITFPFRSSEVVWTAPPFRKLIKSCSPSQATVEEAADELECFPGSALFEWTSVCQTI